MIDVSRIVPGRKGDAVRWPAFELVRPKGTAKYLGLHSSTDDFHASIPLGRGRQGPCDLSSGWPAAAGKERRSGAIFHSRFRGLPHEEIDEFANVKFVDSIELTAEKGSTTGRTTGRARGAAPQAGGGVGVGSRGSGIGRNLQDLMPRGK